MCRTWQKTNEEEDTEKVCFWSQCYLKNRKKFAFGANVIEKTEENAFGANELN